jgi:hypothetical protein
MRSYHKIFRDLLRSSFDGLTAAQISRNTNVDRHTVIKSIKTMPDAYIDRWQVGTRGRLYAVWSVVVPPKDCPKPTRKIDV